ncbi:SRPBCC family protein [Pseudenhygromyxa sp. WMMC2535]|uniref:SRPBCC family protein n=1 Tax=Pseudenhygromyxa sp. WMMC2535 TaxID=2712867 RepID=UPI00159569EF|nr:SRPBCC family protein [Pseudenhygromyxa sp. WMMC2535]NVB38545.1 SRPBCC family protein [Pseudenhygromyxa sp. WMMC2535]
MQLLRLPRPRRIRDDRQTVHHHDFKHIADGVVGAAAIASTVVANPLLRAFYRKWGATEHEAHRLLPGDALIQTPRMQYTRAISIEAPPEQVWPWLIQIGYERAGWYSYDVLEDMAGAGKFVDGDSADRVVPELQTLKVGDEIKLHEQLAFQVHAMNAPRELIMVDARDNETGARFDPSSSERPADFHCASWAFILEEPEGDELPEFAGGTRLLIRWRIDYTPTRSNEIMWKAFVEPINFVMERKMMLGLRKRAEGE